MLIDFSGTTVQSIADTLVQGGGDVDMADFINNEQLPILRHGEAKNGECLVEVADGGTYSRTLAELLALHSPAGSGAYTVTLDGTVSSYRALVTVSMLGNLGQFVSISWRGANG